jgi:PAS domain S-box-containing protein
MFLKTTMTLFFAGQLLAQTKAADATTPLLGYFLAAIVAGIIAAIVLSLQANRREPLEAKQLLTDPRTGELYSSLLRQVSKLPLPVSQQKETAQTLVRIVDQEVTKKTLVVKEELSENYEKLMQENEKNLKRASEQTYEIKQKYETLNKTYQKLNTQKKQTEAVVHSIAEGLVVVNQKGEVLLMNPAAERLLNVDKEKVIGKSIVSDLKDEHFLSLAKGIAGSEDKEIHINSQNDQMRKILRSSNAVIEDESGQTVGMVAVLSDVTRERELEDVKMQFLANVSHEFRTPLYTIQETINLLAEKALGGLTSEQERMISLAKKETERLTRLISDLLDLSKLESGKMQVRPEIFSLNEALIHALSTFEPWAKSKKISLESHLPSESPNLEFDPDRFGQIFTNLVGNAMKFTPPGGKITIEAKKPPAQQTPGGLWVLVRDTGPGIPKKDQEKIFRKFVQLGASPQKGITGTGLGLSIVKEIVTMMEGKIWVESEEGKGSAFTVEIPEKLIR